MGGKRCVRGMRVTVGMIVGQTGAGRSIDELLSEYRYLEREDILQAIRHAARLAQGREVALTPGFGSCLTIQEVRSRSKPAGKQRVG